MKRPCEGSMERTEYLNEKLEGVCLSNNYAESVWVGSTEIIASSTEFKDLTDKPVYLISEDKCYGVISLKAPEQKPFKELGLKREFLEAEDEDSLYVYNFNILKMFDNPVPIKILFREGNYVEKMEFLSIGQTGQKAVSGTPSTFDPLGPVKIIGKKKKKKEGEALTEKELSVVKRDDKWCVVHGHPQKPGSKTDKPEGSVIKCFPTKEQAEAMHKAIIISQIKKEKGGKLAELLNEFDLDELGEIVSSFKKLYVSDEIKQLIEMYSKEKIDIIYRDIDKAIGAVK